jgi:tRNA-specific 2-thiouridylase
MTASIDNITGLNSLDIARAPEDTKVVVAMSGGVDSSVTAALLHAHGYQVIGITLQLYDHGAAIARKGACCAGQDIHDARRVAEDLGFPHYVLDYEKRFSDAVIEHFADSYIKGETPIPCVRCNQTVKFADLLATARDLGADALATGHYIESRPGADGHRHMHVARDLSRDQSYFLFATTQDQLDFLRFPLGTIPKAETRAMARRHGLGVADKPDSQDICFVPNGNYAGVIAKLRPQAADPGEIVHIDGRVLGRHDGIVHYTIGQRRGLGVAQGEPLYVVAIDAGARTVTVGPRAALKVHDLVLGQVNWLGDEPLSKAGIDGYEVYAKIRSTRPAARARVAMVDGEVLVRLEDGDYGLSPGQACVFYDGQKAGARVFGGGWIARADNPAMRKVLPDAEITRLDEPHANPDIRCRG